MMMETHTEAWRVLLVDDDEDDYILTSAMLQDARFRKIQLEWASSYEAGWQLIFAKPYDAILVDYDLVTHTGVDLIRNAVSQGHPAPFLLYTSRGSYEVDVEAMQAGATLYLAKGEANPLLLERVIRYAIELKQAERALRQRSEELEAARMQAENEKRRLEAVMEALPVGVAIKDDRGGLIQANSNYDLVWGGRRPEAPTVAGYAVYQAWWAETGHPLAPEEWASAQAVVKGETVVGQMLEIQRFDGTRAAVINSASPVRAANGKIVGSAVAIQDITRLKDVERAFIKNEERYRMLFNAMLDGFALHEMVYDQHGKPVDYYFLEVNPAFERLTGLKAAEIIGKSVLQVLPQTETHWIETYGEVASTGKSIRFENYSGALRRHYEVVAFSPRKNQFAVLFTDITERKQMEAALRESEQRYRSLFHNNHVVMLLIDPESAEIVDANPAACAFYGYKIEEIRRLKITDLNTLTLGQVHKEMQRAAAELGNHFLFRHRLKNGEIRDVEVYSGPIQVAGKPLLYSMIYDIMERKQQEQEMKDISRFPAENPNPVMRVALNGKLLYANEASSMLLFDWNCRIGQKVPEVWEKHILDAAQSNAPTEMETVCWGRIYSFVLQPILEDEYVNLYGRDVTEQRQAERALAKHLESLQKLIEISIQILGEPSKEGLFQKIVDGARLITEAGIGVLGHQYHGTRFEVGYVGYSPEIPACPPLERFHFPLGGVYKEILQKTSLRLTQEALLHHPDWWGLPEEHAPLRGLLGSRLVKQSGEGTEAIMLSHKREGEFTAEDEALLTQLAALGSLSLQHIHAREDAERRADELDAVINSIADAIAIYDADGKLIRLNPAAVAAYGYNPLGENRHEVISKLSIYHSDGRPILLEDLPSTRALQGQTVTTERYTFTNVGGQKNSILASAAPVRVHGVLTGAVVVFRDISEWETAQAAIQSYARRLEQANRELQDFASTASHDLQEPLRKIQAFSERLRRTSLSSLSEEGLDTLDRMKDAAVRMQRMIDDLLVLSSITTKTQPFTQVDLNQVAHQALSDLEVRLERTGGQVLFEELPTLWADRQQMYQLFLNLIGNALKFSKPGIPPLVKVSSRFLPAEGDIALSVVQIRLEDNGIGFDPRHLDQIFKPFQRLHGRGEYEGTGIGLSICRKIVERHGGAITAESAPGEGAVFLVTLPVEQTSS